MLCYLVDTFADGTNAGNPAGVVALGAFPPDEVMQHAAHRIGVPTTAFVVAAGPGRYRTRWFTPFAEVNLCGHATIAAARILLTRPENTGLDRLRFESDNGVLHAGPAGDLIAIDLPRAQLHRCDPPAGLLEALRLADVRACAVSRDDVLVEIESESEVAALAPDFPALAELPFRGHIVTTRADHDGDFVSRTFFPALGVDEDQVCVTAHAKLAPFWAPRFGRPKLNARQLSQRGGRLAVEDGPETVRVLGHALPRGDQLDLTDLTYSLTLTGPGPRR